MCIINASAFNHVLCGPNLKLKLEHRQRMRTCCHVVFVANNSNTRLPPSKDEGLDKHTVSNSFIRVKTSVA